MQNIWRILSAAALLLAGLALGNASDSKTFTVTVSGLENVQIIAPLTEIDFFTTTSGGYRVCADGSRDTSTSTWIKPYCGVYPTIQYSTNYASNRKLVAKASASGPAPVIVRFKKQSSYGPSGAGAGGVWAFAGDYVDLTATDTDIVTNIGSGSYSIGPVIEIIFDVAEGVSYPAPGNYSVNLTVTILAQ